MNNHTEMQLIGHHTMYVDKSEEHLCEHTYSPHAMNTRLILRECIQTSSESK